MPAGAEQSAAGRFVVNAAASPRTVLDLRYRFCEQALLLWFEDHLHLADAAAGSEVPQRVLRLVCPLF